jgi:nitrite reductase/ring-hydroxylating ferredoxin subunit
VVAKAAFGSVRAVLVQVPDDRGLTQPVIVVATKVGEAVTWTAFLNRCPHARWPLDRFDGTFLFDDGGALMCAAHAASFDPLTGTCLGGPGLGHPLTAVPLAECGDFLQIGPLPGGVHAL